MQKIIKIRDESNLFGIHLPSHTEYNISVERAGDLVINDVVANEIHQLGAVPLNRFVFGGLRHHAPFIASHGAQSCPFTWVQGDTDSSGAIYSTQVTAISGLSVRPITFAGRVVGTTYEDEFAHYVRLSGVLPSDHAASREEQTRSLFENLRDILHGQGMRFTDTLRTWLYMDRLLEWYDIFNVVRTRFFHAEGVFEAMVPASTGIGAANPQGAAIIADLLAVKPKKTQARFFAVGSPLQGSAMNYRSSFSRAAELELPTHRVLYISGTASIDADGKSMHLGDPDKQIEQTMRVVEGILDSRKMGWADVSRAIAYFKNAEDIPRYHRYCHDHGIDRFPLAISHADVCRDDLLFEIELDAIQLNRSTN